MYSSLNDICVIDRWTDQPTEFVFIALKHKNFFGRTSIYPLLFFQFNSTENASLNSDKGLYHCVFSLVLVLFLLPFAPLRNCDILFYYYQIQFCNVQSNDHGIYSLHSHVQQLHGFYYTIHGNGLDMKVSVSIYDLSTQFYCHSVTQIQRHCFETLVENPHDPYSDIPKNIYL